MEKGGSTRQTIVHQSAEERIQYESFIFFLSMVPNLNLQSEIQCRFSNREKLNKWSVDDLEISLLVRSLLAGKIEIYWRQTYRWLHLTKHFISIFSVLNDGLYSDLIPKSTKNNEFPVISTAWSVNFPNWCLIYTNLTNSSCIYYCEHQKNSRHQIWNVFKLLENFLFIRFDDSDIICMSTCYKRLNDEMVNSLLNFKSFLVGQKFDFNITIKHVILCWLASSTLF